jgi:hypothetical protein
MNIRNLKMLTKKKNKTEHEKNEHNEKTYTRHN